MKAYRLKTLQQPKPGFTDLFVIAAADLTVATDDLLQNIALCVLNAGDVVLDNTLLEVVTAASPAPSVNATVTASVGRTSSSYVDCLAASAIMTSGTAVAAKVTYASASTLGHQIIASDTTTLYCQVDINDADGHLSSITAFEIRIWMTISRQKDRDVQA